MSIPLETTLSYFLQRITEKPNVSHGTLCGSFRDDPEGYRRRAHALELLVAQGKIVKSKKPWKYTLKTQSFSRSRTASQTDSKINDIASS